MTRSKKTALMEGDSNAHGFQFSDFMIFCPLSAVLVRWQEFGQ